MIAAPLLLLALQQATIAPTLTTVVDAGNGVEVPCGGTYPTGVGIQLSAPLSHKHAIWLRFAGRDHWMGGGACTALRARPADGTRVEDDNRPLLGQPFVATDVRLAWAFVRDILAVSIGAGNAWRAGRDLPYVVIGGNADAPNTGRMHFGFVVEYQLLGVTSDRYRRTYQGGQLLSETSLGPVHSLSHALSLGVRLEWPL